MVTAAQTLRDAAATMRERAQAATPGPWHVERDEMSEQLCVYNADGVHLAEVSEWSRWLGNADYMALAAPPFALAVAAWLEAESASLDAMETFEAKTVKQEHGWSIRGAGIAVRKHNDGELSIHVDTSQAALDVARTYLGGDQ